MKEMREVRPATATAPRHNLVAEVVLSVVVSKSIVRGMKGLGQPEKGEYLCNEYNAAEEEFIIERGINHFHNEPNASVMRVFLSESFSSPRSIFRHCGSDCTVVHGVRELPKKVLRAGAEVRPVLSETAAFRIFGASVLW
jgi:hypothetical protein